MITEDYCSYEVAKLLKEKGFDSPCIGRYSVRSKEFHLDCTKLCNNGGLFEYAAPTLQMTMKWLREEHYCHIIIDYTFTADANLSDEYVSYCYKVENARTYIQYTHNEWYNTYEKAVEAAIKYCLENLI